MSQFFSITYYTYLNGGLNKKQNRVRSCCVGFSSCYDNFSLFLVRENLFINAKWELSYYFITLIPFLTNALIPFLLKLLFIYYYYLNYYLQRSNPFFTFREHAIRMLHNVVGQGLILWCLCWEEIYLNGIHFSFSTTSFSLYFILS
jgi:hypothetical protein